MHRRTMGLAARLEVQTCRVIAYLTPLSYNLYLVVVPLAKQHDGDWRSWLARAVWDREVEGSSPLSPTIFENSTYCKTY